MSKVRVQSDTKHCATGVCIFVGEMDRLSRKTFILKKDKTGK